MFCIVIDAGALSTVLTTLMVTLVPAAGAFLFRVTEHVAEAEGVRVEGVQASDDIASGATRFTVAEAELLLYAAVRLAVESALRERVVALKVAVV